MSVIKKILKVLKRLAWALLVGYMIAWHNIYREETRMPQDIVITINEEEQTTDPTPKI